MELLSKSKSYDKLPMNSACELLMDERDNIDSNAFTTIGKKNEWMFAHEIAMFCQRLDLKKEGVRFLLPNISNTGMLFLPREFNNPYDHLAFKKLVADEFKKMRRMESQSHF
jgi:uncharacterized metal-binding protein